MIEEAIFTILTNDADVSPEIVNRVYPLRAAENSVTPYIVYQQVSEVDIESFDADNENFEARFQFEVVGVANRDAGANSSRGYKEGKTIGRLSRDAFRDYTGTGMFGDICIWDIEPEGLRDGYDVNTEEPSVVFDVIFKAARTA